MAELSPYQGAGNPYNEILNNKKKWEGTNDKNQQNYFAKQTQGYYSQLDPNEAKQIKGMNATQLGSYRDNKISGWNTTQQGLAPVDPNKYKTESAGIEDIAKKYGFDFSREGSARQAESEAQAKRDAANQGKRGVDSNIEGSVEALDRNYFQKYMQQAQDQTNNGLNAGIASDQDLRMAMSRQAEMGDIYRDGNLEQMRLQDALGRVEQERLAREDGLFFDRTMAGAGLAQNSDQLSQQENLAMLQAAQNQRGQNIGVNQFDQSLAEQQKQSGIGQTNWQSVFNREGDRNKVADSQWQTELDRLLGRDKRSDFVDDRNYNFTDKTYWNDFNNVDANTRAQIAEQAAGRRQSAANAASGSGSSSGLTPYQEIQLMKDLGMLDGQGTTSAPTIKGQAPREEWSPVFNQRPR